MKNKYPINRLQLHYAIRRATSWAITLACAMILCISLLNKAHASGQIDPTDAPGYPSTPPSQAYGSFCPSGVTSCPTYFWFAGDKSTDSHATTVWTNRTCVWVGLTGEQAALGNEVGPSNGNYWVKWKLGPDGGTSGIACWSGSAWSTENRNNIYIHQDSYGFSPPFTFGVPTHITPSVQSAYAGYINTNGNAYACAKTAAGDECTSFPGQYDLITGPTESLSLVGPDAIPKGSDAPFVLTWSLNINPYYIYFRKDVNETFLYPQVQNFPQGSGGSLIIHSYYTQSGTFIPQAVLGDRHCGGLISSSGSLTGSGCQVRTVNATPLQVIDQASVAIAFSNGGYTNGFSTGSGYLFQSDKTYYQVGEDVQLKWFFSTPNPVTKVIVRANGSGGTILATMTGSVNDPIDPNALVQHLSHFMTIHYGSAGEYQPTVNLYSTGSVLMRTLFLGGYSHPNPQYALFVASAVVNPLGVSNKPLGGILGITTASGTVNSASGSVIGAGVLAGSTAGIFGLDIFSTFNGFPKSGSDFLDAIESIIFIAFRAIIYVAEYLYYLFSLSSIYSFVFGIIHPAAGASLVFPSRMFNMAMTVPGLTGTHFTVSYASAAAPGMKSFISFFQVIFGVGLFMFVIRKFFFHP